MDDMLSDSVMFLFCNDPFDDVVFSQLLGICGEVEVVLNVKRGALKFMDKTVKGYMTRSHR